MTLTRSGSFINALTRSLLVGLTILWLAGVLGSGLVLKRLIDEKSDDELQESASMLMSLVRHTNDLLVTAAVLGDRPPLAGGRLEHERFVYQILDGGGRVLLKSHNAPSDLLALPLRKGWPRSATGAS